MPTVNVTMHDGQKFRYSDASCVRESKLTYTIYTQDGDGDDVVLAVLNKGDVRELITGTPDAEQT